MFNYISQLTERMTTVLIIAQVFTLRAVVALVPLSLLVIELETTAATILLLEKIGIKLFSRENRRCLPHRSSKY